MMKFILPLLFQNLEMIMKKLGLATALLLAMTGAQAYQFEVQGQSEYIDNTVNDKDFAGAYKELITLKMLMRLKVLWLKQHS